MGRSPIPMAPDMSKAGKGDMWVCHSWCSADVNMYAACRWHQRIHQRTCPYPSTWTSICQQFRSSVRKMCLQQKNNHCWNRILTGVLQGLSHKTLVTVTWTKFAQKGWSQDYQNIRVCFAQIFARWVRLGAVRGGSTEYCHAGSQYSGPCSDELQAFADMSSAAKQHWSRGCEAMIP